MAVREGLLLLLRERPRHGYDLRSEFESRTGSLWRLNSGQVYTTVGRLERDGLVTSEADDGDPGELAVVAHLVHHAPVRERRDRELGDALDTALDRVPGLPHELLRALAARLRDATTAADID